jgi:hypothetical protein
MSANVDRSIVDQSTSECHFHAPAARTWLNLASSRHPGVRHADQTATLSDPLADRGRFRGLHFPRLVLKHDQHFRTRERCAAHGLRQRPGFRPQSMQKKGQLRKSLRALVLPLHEHQRPAL